MPYRSAVAIDALKIVQAHRGWVSDESLRAIARHLHMSAAELDGIATFYNLIFRRPVGDKVILLCNSISCWIKGCDTLQARISEQLGHRPGRDHRRQAVHPAAGHLPGGLRQGPGADGGGRPARERTSADKLQGAV